MPQSYQQGCVEVIRLDDRLTLDEVDEARPLLFAAMQDKLPQIVIDLRRVRLIDSAGLELLSDVQAACAQRGGSLRLAGANSLLLEVIRVTGLEQAFAFHTDVVSAAGEFAL